MLTILFRAVFVPILTLFALFWPFRVPKPKRPQNGRKTCRWLGVLGFLIPSILHYSTAPMGRGISGFGRDPNREASEIHYILTCRAFPRKKHEIGETPWRNPHPFLGETTPEKKLAKPPPAQKYPKGVRFCQKKGVAKKGWGRRGWGWGGSGG